MHLRVCLYGDKHYESVFTVQDERCNSSNIRFDVKMKCSKVNTKLHHLILKLFSNNKITCAKDKNHLSLALIYSINIKNLEVMLVYILVLIMKK